METASRIAQAYALLSPCRICPRMCRVNRVRDGRGFCGTGHEPIVSSAGPHFGEESCLVGQGGSGTIFLAGCNLGCVFCQNYDISHRREGEEVSLDELVRMMLALERCGCENINFVSPTHVSPQLLDAVVRARTAGLTLPIVWNSGGYESVEMLRLLDGHVEVYMPDIKYGDDATGERLSGATNYWSAVRPAVREMHRQVGDLVVEDGIARRGLLVRHLVLPGGLAGTEKVVDFLADQVSSNTFINVMGQYHPEYQAHLHPELTRRLTGQEIAIARRYAADRGLRLAN
jgi:putative pyruvate formate lyase activating enzyme